MGGLYGTLGMDGPWDVKRILGTVPVNADGSAYFTIPANTPLSLQPLDEQGQALQLMRTWLVGMPGERVSCVGCHESEAGSTVARDARGTRRGRRRLSPGTGRRAASASSARSSRCSTATASAATTARRPSRPAWRRADHRLADADGRPLAGRRQVHQVVCRAAPVPAAAGIEGDRRMLSPLDYHFSQTELGQMLRKGHHGVALDAETCERLAAWLDLNAPFYGTWGEIPQFTEGYGLKLREADDDVARAAGTAPQVRPDGAVPRLRSDPRDAEVRHHARRPGADRRAGLAGHRLSRLAVWRGRMRCGDRRRPLRPTPRAAWSCC